MSCVVKFCKNQSDQRKKNYGITSYRKSNVLGKVIVPRLNETSHYINSELEEREREEVFRLKRVKQKKDWEKEIEKQKRQGLIDEKGMPIKSEDRKDTAPPSKAESTTKSLGGSRTNLNRPPETVNLLILNPRDELDPTSVSSTFISPYGGKTIPGITRVDELIDEKDSVNNLTVAEIKADRSKESEDKRVDEQQLNEPARKLVHEITKGENVDGSQNRNIHAKDNTASSILSETMTNRTLEQDSENIQGYSADLEVSKKDVRNIQQSNALDSLPTVNFKEIKVKFDATKETLKRTSIDIIHSEDTSKIKPDIAEPTDYEVKNIPGTTNRMPKKTTSSNIDTESSNSKNEQFDGEKVKLTEDDKTDQQHLNTPAKMLISEVVKDIITDKDENKSEKIIMKDAETNHDISMSSVATQYEYMNEQVAEITKTPVSDRHPKVHIDGSHYVEKDLKINDDTEGNWEFVLANDQQGDDVDTKPIIIKEIRDIKENDTNTIDNATSSKFLKIKDSITCIRNFSDMDETEDDVSEDGKTSKDEEKKKRKRRKKKENVDDKCSEDPTNH